MSKTKFLTLALAILIGNAAQGQSLAEQAEAVRAKEAKELEVATPKPAPATVTVEAAKPKPMPVALPVPGHQVHSVINRNGTWFAEIARANLLSLALEGVQINNGKVSSITSRGISLVYPPDAKCLAKKSKLKGKQQEKLDCPFQTKFVPVGGYF
jgi:hypothetical protein